MKNNNVKFEEFYKDFLGIDLKCDSISAGTFTSASRNLPLNKEYFYPVIFTDYYGRLTCSTSKKFEGICNDKFQGRKSDMNIILREINFKYSSKDYTNYSLDIVNDPKFSLVKVRRYVYFSDIKKESSAKIDDSRSYLKNEVDGFVAQARITDIYESVGANIAVYTDPKFRNKGHGKNVVSGAINICIEKNILPMYIVEDNNWSSIILAEKLGFEFVCYEYLVRCVDGF